MQVAYKRAKEHEKLPAQKITNQVASLYDEFSYEEVSDKIAEIVTPKGVKPEVKVIYQTIDGLHEACPRDKGDGYFMGKFPTPGGNRVVNRAFINYMEGIDERAY